MKLTNNLSIDTQMSVYIDQGFSAFQLREIRSGLEQGLDVSVYAKKTHGYQLMSLAIHLLKANINLDHCIENDRLDVNRLLDTYFCRADQHDVTRLDSLELMMVKKYAYCD